MFTICLFICAVAPICWNRALFTQVYDCLQPVIEDSIVHTSLRSKLALETMISKVTVSAPLYKVFKTCVLQLKSTNLFCRFRCSVMLLVLWWSLNYLCKFYRNVVFEFVRLRNVIQLSRKESVALHCVLWCPKWKCITESTLTPVPEETRVWFRRGNWHWDRFFSEKFHVFHTSNQFNYRMLCNSQFALLYCRHFLTSVICLKSSSVLFYLFLFLFVHPSVLPPVHPFVRVCLSVCLSVRLSVYSSIHPSIHP
jgi:hypothetical protein